MTATATAPPSFDVSNATKPSSVSNSTECENASTIATPFPISDS